MRLPARRFLPRRLLHPVGGGVQGSYLSCCRSWSFFPWLRGWLSSGPWALSWPGWPSLTRLPFGKRNGRATWRTGGLLFRLGLFLGSSGRGGRCFLSDQSLSHFKSPSRGCRVRHRSLWLAENASEF
jgi:hypothetical protein